MKLGGEDQAIEKDHRVVEEIGAMDENKLAHIVESGGSPPLLNN